MLWIYLSVAFLRKIWRSGCAKWQSAYLVNQYRTQIINHDKQINISFSDIANGNIINQLTDIANLIGIELIDERRDNCISLIETYKNSQIPVPWELPLNLY